MSSVSSTDYAKTKWNPCLLFFIFPLHFRNRGKYFALSVFCILDLDRFDFSHVHGWLQVLDIITVPWPMPDSRRIRLRLLLWREVWVWPKLVDAGDPNFQGSSVLHFSLLCTSFFFPFLAPSPGRGIFTLAPDDLLIHGLSPFTNTTKKLRSNSGKHSNMYYLSWKEQVVEIKRVPSQCCRQSAVPPT